MAKIGGGSNANQIESEPELSPWQKFTLSLVDPNSDRWFEDYGPLPLQDQFETEFAQLGSFPSLFSQSASDNLKIVPEFEIRQQNRGEIQDIPESSLGQALLQFLKTRGVTMDYKTTWLVAHESEMMLDVRHHLTGQWATESGTPFLQSLEIYKDANGEKTAYWFVDLLASPAPVASYNTFHIREENGGATPAKLTTDDGGWTVGEVFLNLHLPPFIKQLAYMSETPFPSTQILAFGRDLAFKNVPAEARPTPFFTVLTHGSILGFSNIATQESGLPGHKFAGGVFPETVRFGWRIGESAIPYLEEIMPVVVDGCTMAMTIVEDGFKNYRDLDYPAPWDDMVGSPCMILSGYETSGSRQTAPQWVPNTAIGDIVRETISFANESTELASAGKHDEAERYLWTIIRDGAGPVIVHAINTLLYSHLIPSLFESPELIDDIEGLAQLAIDHEMVGQSTNAMSNLGIAYFLVGNLEASRTALTAALERADGYAEREASYFLSLIEESIGNTLLAEQFRNRCDQAGGYEPPVWLGRSVGSATGMDQSKPQPPKSFCGNCGTKFEDGTKKFCSECGEIRS